MIKLIHGADFHLDSPFASLPEDKAAQRREEQRRLLDDLAELSLRERVDAVILSGDMLDSDHSHYETGEALVRAFSKMRAQVFIAPGNHDYYHKLSPWAVLHLPDNVHVFTSSVPQAVELRRKRCVVWGAAFTSSKSTALLREMPTVDRNTVNIMAVHGLLGTDEPYNPISEQQIRLSGLHYLALGHEHTYSGLQQLGDTYYAYPGCPEGRGFDETGDKGVIVAEIDERGVRTRLVPLAKRRYQKLDVDIQDRQDIQKAILAALPRETKEDIYQLTLTGEHEGKLDLAQITAGIADRFFHVVVKDGTRVPRDIWAQAEEDSLRGLFLRKMRTRYQQGDPAQQEQVVLAVRYALAAMENGEQWTR